MMRYKTVDRILNKKEVCELLGISLRTLNRWMQRGQVPFISIGIPEYGDGRLLFSKNKIMELVDAVKKGEVDDYMEDNDRFLSLEVFTKSLYTDLRSLIQRQNRLLASDDSGVIVAEIRQMIKEKEKEIKRFEKKKVIEFFELDEKDDIDVEAIKSGRQKAFMRPILKQVSYVPEQAETKVEKREEKANYRRN